LIEFVTTRSNELPTSAFSALLVFLPPSPYLSLNSIQPNGRNCCQALPSRADPTRSGHCQQAGKSCPRSGHDSARCSRESEEARPYRTAGANCSALHTRSRLRNTETRTRRNASTRHTVSTSSQSTPRRLGIRPVRRTTPTSRYLRACGCFRPQQKKPACGLLEVRARPGGGVLVLHLTGTPIIRLDPGTRRGDAETIQHVNSVQPTGCTRCTAPQGASVRHRYPGQDQVPRERGADTRLVAYLFRDTCANSIDLSIIY